MSGQYPGGYQSPVAGHRGNFTNQMMQQQMNQMGVTNQIGGMMGYNQNNVMQNQQQMQNSGGMVQPNQDMGMQQNMTHMTQQQQQQMQQQPQAQQQQSTQQSPQLSLTPTTPNNTSNMMVVQQSMQVQSTAPAPNQQAPSLQQKEFNLLTLCRIGQETVQDIVSRFQEVFGILRTIQPPNGTNSGLTTSNDKKAKVQEQFRTIRLLFKRLRLLYDKCNDNCQQGMEYTHVESLIPLKDEPDHKPEPAPTEEYKKALQENRELIDIVMLKNKQLREVIDRIRIIIWEINTMLSMRRS